MALIECPDCRTNVSEKATRCPRCGRSEQTPFSVMMTGLFLAFNAAMALWLGGELISDVGVPSRATQAWAPGSVIFGMLALVVRRRCAALRLTPDELRRRRRDRDSESDDRQGGRE